jgi:plastocyanin
VRPTARPIVLAIEAKDSLFVPASLNGPAAVPFQIAFTNSDAAIPHNVAIATQAGSEPFQGRIINGVQTVTYSVAALPAGTYQLRCTVHPAMTGSLTLN